MKVQILTIMAGPGGTFQPGSVVDLPNDQAKQLISSRQAKPYIEPRRTATVPLPEMRQEPPPAVQIPGVEPALVLTLMEAGLLEDGGTDEAILAVNGVGKATLEKIRAWQQLQTD